MGKCNRFRDHIDPEYQRWGRTYPRFPGVAECVRLILARKATGVWADIIVDELAENAAECLDELTNALREDDTGHVAMHVMMALEIAELPASVDFVSHVLREGDRRLVPFARRTLQAINTRESRTALFQGSRAEPGHTPESAVRPDSNGDSSPPTR